jgi:hypothetical protein
VAVRNWQRRAVAVGLLLGAATGGTGCSTMPMGIADLQQPPGLAQGTSAQYPVASGVRAPVLPATIPGEAPGRTAPAEIRLVGAPAQPEQATDLPAPRLADHPAVPPGPLPHPDVPTELRKAPLPAYIIEPPDILLIESPRALPDQPISGEHLVRPDGTVGLGLYGSVPVAGLTLDQARAVIEAHLTAFIKNPKVSEDVFAYNSKAV